MIITNIFAIVFTLLGLFFFIAGTVGLLRFPDVFSRLHALTKSDNVGLGMIIVGIIFYSAGSLLSFKLILIWFFVLIISSANCYLIAQYAQGIEPDKN